jgi:glycosyltransferase involved in cell wall biosynthesis
MLRAVDAVVAITKSDARTFAALAGVEPIVVPPALTFERAAWNPPPTAAVCYVGSLAWQPNVAGLDWLCREVWPHVRALRADLELLVVGSGLPNDVVPLQWRVPGVTTLGFVEDLSKVYARSCAMVAPVFGGSGVRMKLLEGMRAGLPTVTTPDGMAGMGLEDGREAMIEANPARFAERLVELTCDVAMQRSLREAAYAYLDAHHAPQVVRAALWRAVTGVAPEKKVERVAEPHADRGLADRRNAGAA